MGYVEELRKMVGTRPLILVGIAVAVVNENGELLLQKRPDGVWGLPGGLLELGESTEEAGRREVLEETGLEIVSMELIGVFSGKEYYRKLPNGDEFYPVTIAYLCREIRGGALEPDGRETVEAGFFKLHELPEALSPTLRDLIVRHARKLLR